jgi:VanZ family protein
MLRLLRWIGDRLARVPRALAAALAALWGAFVWWLSSGPPPEVPLRWRFAYVFNLAHAPLFAVLALLVALALPRDPGANRWPVLTRAAQGLVLVLVVAYALVDEWHQASTPERTATLRDVATDFAGAAAALVVAGYLARADARPVGLWVRLAVGLAACCGAAWLATAG